MTDRYQQFATSGPGRVVIRRLGLPDPVRLRRYQPGQPLLTDPALIGAAPGGRLLDAVAAILTKADADVRTEPDSSTVDTRYGALVFDATGITAPEQLRQLHDFFHPVIRGVAGCGRVLVLGTPPESVTPAAEKIAQRALEGFTRSAGKELRRGATVQLVYVAKGAEDAVE
ncbi:MAG TPA: short chain dehydrogenase, partial [Pseudonocardiaceae bacterium]|nr:short chain dehydrogenase [Pseudonocardiaceae bacterium]